MNDQMSAQSSYNKHAQTRTLSYYVRLLMVNNLRMNSHTFSILTFWAYVCHAGSF